MSINKENNFNLTVPRKRRPRPVGEVYISSTSKIFLNRKIDNETISKNENNSEEPFYQNTSNNLKSNINNKIKHKNKEFTRIRYKNEENYKQTDLKETQIISTFIGKLKINVKFDFFTEITHFIC